MEKEERKEGKVRERERENEREREGGRECMRQTVGQFCGNCWLVITVRLALPPSLVFSSASPRSPKWCRLERFVVLVVLVVAVLPLHNSLQCHEWLARRRIARCHAQQWEKNIGQRIAIVFSNRHHQPPQGTP